MIFFSILGQFRSRIRSRIKMIRIRNIGLKKKKKEFLWFEGMGEKGKRNRGKMKGEKGKWMVKAEDYNDNNST